MIRPLAFAAALFMLAPAAASAAPAIWQVSDGDSKLWLFGSIHVLPKTIAWRTDAFNDVLKQAETVYFEADIGPLGQIGIVLASVKMGFTQNQHWLSKLSWSETARLDAAVAALGLNKQTLGSFAPWLAEATIEDAVLHRLGYSASLGVDETMQAELPKERKAYFETAAGQLELLASDSEEKQIKRLMATVDDVGNIPREIGEMADAWSAGKPEALATALTNDPSMDDAFAKKMVLDRNANWLKTIEQLLADNHQDLIIVGAGHLVGDGSVPDLLTKAGFTVTRIQ